MLIAEDLLLLAYDDATGKPDAWLSDLDTRLGGAMLLELALAGRVGISDGASPAGPQARRGHAVVLDPSPTGNPLLDGALGIVAAKPRKPKDLVAPLAKNLKPALLHGLAQRGILRREDGRVLGIFPTTAWPAQDSTHETALRAECGAVLLGQQQPTPRTAALLALAQGTTLIKHLVPPERRREAQARAKELLKTSWAHDAVTKAVDEMQAAIMVAVMVPIMAGAATSG
jgi:hypothetical protein